MKKEVLIVTESVNGIYSGKNLMKSEMKKSEKKSMIIQKIGSQNQDGVEREYNYCLRCGKHLKTPEARKIGYGPVCLKKVKYSVGRRLFDI